MNLHRRLFAPALVLAVLPAVAFAAPAQAPDGFPSHQMHVIVPFPPGGACDMPGRLVAQKLGGEYLTSAAGIKAE